MQQEAKGPLKLDYSEDGGAAAKALKTAERALKAYMLRFAGLTA